MINVFAVIFYFINLKTYVSQKIFSFFVNINIENLKFSMFSILLKMEVQDL